MSSNGVLKNDSKARLSSPDVEPKQTNNNIWRSFENSSSITSSQAIGIPGHNSVNGHLHTHPKHFFSCTIKQ